MNPTDPFRTPERLALRSVVRQFIEKDVLPHLDSWERAGDLPRDLHLRAAQVGLLGLHYPEHAGGGGGDAVDLVVLVEEALYAGASGGLIAGLLTTGISVPHIIAAGDSEQIERWVRPTLAGEKIGALAITEPDGGSDVGGLRTSAVRDGDVYRGQRREDLHHLRLPRRLRGDRGPDRRAGLPTGSRCW